uniref:Odorant receptor n=1 Tax=Bradysia odoriphaga TaxID=1564500 RepID=A0A6B9C9R3_9DIPT|nr:odorant receptor 26 [Bradysia odoriphaga]
MTGKVIQNIGLRAAWLFFICCQFIYSQVLYIRSGQYNRFFEVTSMYGLTFSCALKIWMFLNYRKEMIALHKFSIKITRLAGSHLAEKLATQQFYIVKLCKIFAVIGLLGELLYIYQPVAELITTRKLVPLMPIEMMFLDPTKVLDFVIFNSVLVVVGVWCPFYLFAVNFNFTTAILNCKIQVIIIEDDIQRLDAFWREPQTTTVVERHMLLKNICQKCQDKNRYVDVIKNMFDRPLFWYFCVAYTSQIICLYEIEVESWMPGYGIACGSFTEMMIYCFIGTKLFQINEQLCCVLTQSKWYTWDVFSQKMFLNLLNSSMNLKELWIGPLAPLSVVSLIQMVKSIYTYYTFLSEAL